MTAPQTPTNFLVDIKSAVVRALRSSFDDVNYPDEKIQGINISMEYPMEENSYPHLWVQFSLTKWQNAGINHVSWEDNTLRREFYFEGKFRLNIVALSSKARDIYASQLLQMLSFRDLNPIASQFDDFMQQSNVSMGINRDSLEIQGQQTTLGTPWSDNEPVYEDGYAFNVMGTVKSTFSTTPEVLKKIVMISTGDIGSEEKIVQTLEFTKNGITPGVWQ